MRNSKALALAAILSSRYSKLSMSSMCRGGKMCEGGKMCGEEKCVGEEMCGEEKFREEKCCNHLK